MKRHWKIIISTIFIILVGGYLLFMNVNPFIFSFRNTPQKIPSPSGIEIYACTIDSDCIKAPDIACHSGCSKAINKSYRDYWVQLGKETNNKLKRGELVVCATNLCPFSLDRIFNEVPRCVNSRCIMGKR